ncbi:MAG: hypothetical protein IKF47_00660 [Bacilli bacterium]|nr:hypothetical protein [Bacilli bacterium]
MEEKEMITIQKSDNTTMTVELVTYLLSDDLQNKYVVYSKGEKTGVADDEIIYVSKLTQDNGILKISEIVDDNEWLTVQNLLKRIANA